MEDLQKLTGKLYDICDLYHFAKNIQSACILASKITPVLNESVIIGVNHNCKIVYRLSETGDLQYMQAHLSPLALQQLNIIQCYMESKSQELLGVKVNPIGNGYHMYIHAKWPNREIINKSQLIIP